MLFMNNFKDRELIPFEHVSYLSIFSFSYPIFIIYISSCFFCIFCCFYDVVANNGWFFYLTITNGFCSYFCRLKLLIFERLWHTILRHPLQMTWLLQWKISRSIDWFDLLCLCCYFGNVDEPTMYYAI
jgi:hypothetical protein